MAQKLTQCTQTVLITWSADRMPTNRPIWAKAGMIDVAAEKAAKELIPWRTDRRVAFIAIFLSLATPYPRRNWLGKP
jgi:hypothetical protein